VRILSGGYYKWVNEQRPIYRDPEELVNKVAIQHAIAGWMLVSDAKLSRKERKEKRRALKENKKSVKNRSDCHKRHPCGMNDDWNSVTNNGQGAN